MEEEKGRIKSSIPVMSYLIHVSVLCLYSCIVHCPVRVGETSLPLTLRPGEPCANKTGNVGTYNVTLRRVRTTIAAVEKQ
jgi:hypothetical protein